MRVGDRSPLSKCEVSSLVLRSGERVLEIENYFEATLQRALPPDNPGTVLQVLSATDGKSQFYLVARGGTEILRGEWASSSSRPGFERGEVVQRFASKNVELGAAKHLTVT